MLARFHLFQMKVGLSLSANKALGACHMFQRLERLSLRVVGVDSWCADSDHRDARSVNEEIQREVRCLQRCVRLGLVVDQELVLVCSENDPRTLDLHDEHIGPVDVPRQSSPGFSRFECAAVGVKRDHSLRAADWHDDVASGGGALDEEVAALVHAPAIFVRSERYSDTFSRRKPGNALPMLLEVVLGADCDAYAPGAQEFQSAVYRRSSVRVCTLSIV